MFSAESLSSSAIAANMSTETSASMASLNFLWSVIWEMVRLDGSPNCSDRAFTKGAAATIRFNNPAVISHGRGGRPSSSVNSFVRPARCLPPSIFLASDRSSAEVSRRTRPISRRYMRTGSSKTSTDSVSGSHSGSSASLSSSLELSVVLVSELSASFSGV